MQTLCLATTLGVGTDVVLGGDQSIGVLQQVLDAGDFLPHTIALIEALQQLQKCRHICQHRLLPFQRIGIGDVLLVVRLQLGHDACHLLADLPADTLIAGPQEQFGPVNVGRPGVFGQFQQLLFKSLVVALECLLQNEQVGFQLQIHLGGDVLCRSRFRILGRKVGPQGEQRDQHSDQDRADRVGNRTEAAIIDHM